MSLDASTGKGATITADAQVARIFEWRRGFNAMHLIDLGIRLGLFKAIADAPGATARSLAERLALHPPYVAVWCTTAYAFELLDADADGRFQLAPFVSEILANPSHPRYLGGYVQLGTRFATEDYRLAPEAFRSGATAPFQGRSREFADVVAQAIAGVNVMVARKILPGLPGVAERLQAGGRPRLLGRASFRRLAGDRRRDVSVLACRGPATGVSLSVADRVGGVHVGERGPHARGAGAVAARCGARGPDRAIPHGRGLHPAHDAEAVASTPVGARQ